MKTFLSLLFGAFAPALLLANYCPANSNFPWHDWIAAVKIGSIQNPSGKSQYSDFTAQTTALTIGTPAQIELTAGFSYFTFDEYWKVWIDLDHDGQFADPAEAVVSQILTRPTDGTPTKTLTINLLVPGFALTGPTRMRVSMGRGAFAAPCGTQPFGEVEDYTVNILPAASLPDLRPVGFEVIPGNGICATNPGQKFGVFGGLVFNAGPVGAGVFNAKAWLSTDNVLGNADDIFWQSLQYTSINPNVLSGNPVLGLDINAPVPAATPLGFYTAFVQVDADNQVVESDETNNVFQANVQIGAPDWAMHNLSSVSATVNTGGQLGFFVQIQNITLFPLPAPTDGATLTAYLSTDNVFDFSDLSLGSQFVSSTEFNAAGFASKNFLFNVPSTVGPGNYYLVLRVDPAGICELNYANNTLVGPLVPVANPLPGSYCTSTSAFPWHDWIAVVKVGNAINSLNNPSGKSNYTDFTAKVASVDKGASVNMELTTGFSYFTFDEYWKVWIDFDHDGVFADPAEAVVSQISARPPDGTTYQTLTTNISIPNTALTGLTRMRVSMKRGAFATPCETLPFGEVEDYTVNIQPGGPLPNLFMTAWEVIPANDFFCFTNPGQTFPSFGGVVLNTGNAGGSAFKIKTWLSTDNVPGNAGDILWQTEQYPAFPYNPNSIFVGGIAVSVPVPAATPLGFYKAIVKVDGDDEVAESNETDNLFIADVQIGAPDLGLQNLANVPASVPVGGSLGCFVEVKYGNNFPKTGLLASSVQVSAYLSADNVFDFTDASIGSQSFSYAEFNAFGLAPKNFNFSVPGTVAPGNYFLILRVAASEDCESNYADNTLVGSALSVVAGQPGAYCGSISNFPWEDWISSVKIAGTQKNSGKSQYSDFTGTSFFAVAGATLPVELTSAYSYFTYDEYWKIWLDLNQNGTFEEPGEVVFQQILTRPADGPNVTKTLAGSLSIPNTALVGPTRMRVSMKRGAFASPCETLSFGEVEDYTFSVGPALAPGVPRAENPPQTLDIQRFTVFPNPAGEEVFVHLPDGGAGNFSVKIFDQHGILRHEQAFEKTTEPSVRISLADFRNGVYWLQIQPENKRAVGRKLVVARMY